MLTIATTMASTNSTFPLMARACNSTSRHPLPTAGCITWEHISAPSSLGQKFVTLTSSTTHMTLFGLYPTTSMEIPSDSRFSASGVGHQFHRSGLLLQDV